MRLVVTMSHLPPPVAARGILYSLCPCFRACLVFVFLIDTNVVLVIPYVLASSPVVHIEAQKRPQVNRPRGFRVFFFRSLHAQQISLKEVILSHTPFLNNFRFRSQQHGLFTPHYVDQPNHSAYSIILGSFNHSGD